jgi:hypothetical protein
MKIKNKKERGKKLGRCDQNIQFGCKKDHGF